MSISPDPYAFLDRDGTIIEERHYLSDPDQVEMLPEAIDGLSKLQSIGYKLAVVTNQSGIGRGFFSRSDAEAVNQRIMEILSGHGVTIEAWYMCPHAPTDPCLCRKPLPGMIDEALIHKNIDLSRSIVIGDKDVDMLLAKNKGLRGFLVRTGHGATHVKWAEENGLPVAQSILEVANQLS